MAFDTRKVEQLLSGLKKSPVKLTADISAILSLLERLKTMPFSEHGVEITNHLLDNITKCYRIVSEQREPDVICCVFRMTEYGSSLLTALESDSTWNC